MIQAQYNTCDSNGHDKKQVRMLVDVNTEVPTGNYIILSIQEYEALTRPKTYMDGLLDEIESSWKGIETPTPELLEQMI